MTGGRRLVQRAWVVAAFLAVAFLPVVASALRPPTRERCAGDGVVLVGGPTVRITDATPSSHAFCSVRCAERWVAAHSVAGQRAPGRHVLLKDDRTGAEIGLADAWFVWSRVGSPPGDGVRAFLRREDADAHVATFGGTLLEGARRPFPLTESP
ncbi:MAG: nitrous oxide reductase accessory protein NosL [Planctomycetes bacterium]|nr:nitrous oxide reductase accessory protein NosL [Planctomycetota bacterium]